MLLSVQEMIELIGYNKNAHIEYPPWFSYKEEDGQQSDGFRQFLMRLAEWKTA